MPCESRESVRKQRTALNKNSQQYIETSDIKRIRQVKHWKEEKHKHKQINVLVHAPPRVLFRFMNPSFFFSASFCRSSPPQSSASFCRSSPPQSSASFCRSSPPQSSASFCRYLQNISKLEFFRSILYCQMSACNIYWIILWLMNQKANFSMQR